MVTLRPFFSNFLPFFILLLHLGCFIFSSHPRRRRRRHDAPKTSIFSSFKRFFSSTPPPPVPSPSSSTRSLRQTPPIILPPPETTSNEPKTQPEIHPCSVCGEIFQSPSLLDLHQSSKHAISHLTDGENIIRMIFKMGWPGNANNPIIHRILKIHNSPRIITRFEEYREFVKSRAAAKVIKSTLRDQRCIADGNELLRFYCTTFICELDYSICNQQYCSLCGIIKNGFSPKMDGISTLPTGYRAHVTIPEDIEEEFKFMNVKRGLLVCRVISGRVGCDPGLVDKDDPGFDSLAGQGNGDEEDELVVFNPRAVLPCFVIVYTV